jgi:iron complex outermembrane receptor protein
VSKDFFPKNAAQLYDIALNAPKHKIGLSVQCGSLSNGLDAQLRGRYVEGFPVNSGVYIGAVQTYTVIDFDGGYDLADKTKFLFAVQNIFDRHYREFVGAPIVGRLVMARLSRSL